MTWDAARREYDTRGFVVIRNFLDPESLGELCRELERYIRDVVPHLPDSDAFYQDKSRPETLKQMQHMDGDPFFQQYRRHPRWQELADVLVGEPTTADAPEWFNKPPGTQHVTPPHQDNYYFCLTPPHVVTIWLALDDVDAENGCLRYVSGSHQQGFRPHARSNILGFSQGITDYSPADFAGEVPVLLRPGDAVAHHGMTIHRADANLSAVRQRRSFAMVFRGASCVRDHEAYARYLASARSQHADLGLQT